MPEALQHYWRMWNERDLDQVRAHLESAVTEDIEWVDPLHSHVGRDALEANVRQFRTEYPKFSFEVVSAIDGHHDRLRYRWDMKLGRRVLLKGLDIVTMSDDELMARVEGFFGELSDLAPVDPST